MELRHQVALATSALCFVIVATLALGAALVGRNEAMKAATNNLNDIAVTFAERLERGLGNRLGLIEHLAALEPVGGMWEGPPQALRKVLARTREAMADTAWLGFATADGTIRAAAGGAFEGQSVSHHDWFRRGLVRPVVIDSAAHGAPSAAGSPSAFADTAIQRFVEMGVPVRDASGALLGVLGLYLSPLWVERLRATTIADVDASQDIRITLIADDGAGAFDPIDAPPSRSGAEIASLSPHGDIPPALTQDGLLAAFATVAGSASRPTWIVAARQSAAVAFRPADRIVATIVGLGVLVAVAGILGAMLIAARVSRPFQILADKAALIGRDSDEMLPRVRGSFEASRLSTVLRALVMRLTYAERSTAEVEDRAAETERQLNRDIAKLRSLAQIDPLTELFNRRAFMEFGEDAMEQFRRYRRPFAILMIDIDNLKQVNDGLGHAAGDAVIRAVAHAIALTLRPSDKGARFGGEEFVALLREVSPREAHEVAERLRAQVAGFPVAVNAMGELFVTVSVGIAVCDGDRDIQSVIERADVALYSAKGDGRNRIVVAPPTIAEERRIA